MEGNIVIYSSIREKPIMRGCVRNTKKLATWQPIGDHRLNNFKAVNIPGSQIYGEEGFILSRELLLNKMQEWTPHICYVPLLSALLRVALYIVERRSKELSLGCWKLLEVSQGWLILPHARKKGRRPSMEEKRSSNMKRCTQEGTRNHHVCNRGKSQCSCFHM